MAFCPKCGANVNGFANFCPSCGNPQKEVQTGQGSTAVFKYEKNPMLFLLLDPVEISIDGRLNFRLAEGREVCYNLEPGQHSLSAYVPYLAGSKFGVTDKSFYIGNNERLQIIYKPPMAMFLSGEIVVRRI